MKMFGSRSLSCVRNIVFSICCCSVSSFASAGDVVSFHSAVDTGIGTVDEDWFFRILAEQGISIGGFSAVAAAPLQFLIVDRGHKDRRGLRENDWDDSSDFLRIVPRASFATEFDNGVIEALFGEQNGVGIGHGSVMDHYYNSTDMDHYRGGLGLRLDYSANGVEWVMNDVVKPEILAGRVYLSPLSWFFDGEWSRRLKFGYSLGVDVAAPRRVDSSESTSVPVTGGDVALTIFDNRIIELITYADLMVMDGDLGFHLGAASTFTLSKSKGLFIHFRGEYRYCGSDYHPAIFNPFYEYNRHRYGEDEITGLDYTFADALALTDPKTGHGLMFDAVFDWHQRIGVEARYDSEGGDRPHWLLFRLEVSPRDILSFSAFYAGQDLQGDGGVFSADSLVGLSARYEIAGPFSAFADFTRRWRRLDGSIKFANETGFGFGILFVY